MKLVHLLAAGGQAAIEALLDMHLIRRSHLIQEAVAGNKGLNRGPDAPLLTSEEALLWYVLSLCAIQLEGCCRACSKTHADDFICVGARGSHALASCMQ